MRTTITLDDELLARAESLIGPMDRSEIVRAGLIALVERESARQLARLGGSEPHLRPVRRRRQSAAP